MNIENMIQGNPQALVKSVNGIMVADSLQVADSFGKQHSHVLRAIESLITSLSTEEAAVNDEEWMYKKIAGNSQSNFGLAGNYFIPDTYADKQGKERKHYWLTRDGFSLLVMGFTGPAALHWKLLYIEAFNKMEQALRSNVDIRQLVTQITTDVFGLVQILLQKTSDYARQQVKVRIEDIVSEALNVVFGGNHKFMIDLTLRGNQPIAEYYLNDDSVITKLEKPDYDRGGGKIDIIALALRLAVGEMEGVDGPLFLDEVGKHVSKEYAPSVAYFLKEYSATFAYAFRLVHAMAYMNQKGRRYITLEELQQGKIEAINLPRIEINGERGYDLKGVRDCTYTKAIT